MKTIEEQIAVMQHFANGGEIENTDPDYKEDGKDYIWDDCYKPILDWSSYGYRIKEKKQTVIIEKWLCIDKIDIKTNRYYILEATEEYFEKYLLSYEKIKLLDIYEIELDSTEE